MHACTHTQPYTPNLWSSPTPPYPDSVDYLRQCQRLALVLVEQRLRVDGVDQFSRRLLHLRIVQLHPRPAQTTAPVRRDVGLLARARDGDLREQTDAALVSERTDRRLSATTWNGTDVILKTGITFNNNNNTYNKNNKKKTLVQFSLFHSELSRFFN